jgi:hypothetical protein
VDRLQIFPKYGPAEIRDQRQASQYVVAPAVESPERFVRYVPNRTRDHAAVCKRIEFSLLDGEIEVGASSVWMTDSSRHPRFAYAVSLRLCLV